MEWGGTFQMNWMWKGDDNGSESWICATSNWLVPPQFSLELSFLTFH